MTDLNTLGNLTDDQMFEYVKIVARTELYLQPEQVDRIGLDTPIVGTRGADNAMGRLLSSRTSGVGVWT